MHNFKASRYDNPLLEAVNKMDEYLDRESMIVVEAGQKAFAPMMVFLEDAGMDVVAPAPHLIGLPFPNHLDRVQKQRTGRVAMKIIQQHLIVNDLLSWDELKRYRAFIDPCYKRNL